jgi:hypothetical protein
VRGSGLAAAALLLVVTLAGCSTPPAKPGPSAVLDVPSVAPAGDGTGGIAGVVVDAGIRPIANATVQVMGQANVTTDHEGRFSLTGIKPGLYFINVRAPRYLLAKTSAQVKEGDATPVRILLTADLRPVERHQTLHFRGHIDLWVGQKPVEDNAPGTLQCTCVWSIAPDGVVQMWVIEAKGTATLENPYDQPNPPAARGTITFGLYADKVGGTGRTGSTNFPFVSHIKGDIFANSTKTFVVRLVGANWPAGQIDYDLYVTMFQGAEAPPEWSFLKGDV